MFFLQSQFSLRFPFQKVDLLSQPLYIPLNPTFPSWFIFLPILCFLQPVYSATHTLAVLTGPILNIEGMGVFFRAHFLKKRHFVCLFPLKRCHFQPFPMKIIFSKFRALDRVQQLHSTKVWNRPDQIAHFYYAIAFRILDHFIDSICLNLQNLFLHLFK